MNLQKILLSLVWAVLLSLNPPTSFASDIKIPEGSVRVTPSQPIEGQPVRIYAFSSSEDAEDATGTISFFSQGNLLGTPQFFSLVNRRSDDVFLDWTPPFGGYYTITARATLSSGADQNPENNTASLKNLFVDYDTDGDGVGNLQDIDDDNDGLRDEGERKQRDNLIPVNVSLPPPTPDERKKPIHLAPLVASPFQTIKPAPPSTEIQDSFQDPTDTDRDGISDTLERRLGFNPFLSASGKQIQSIFDTLSPTVLGVKIRSLDSDADGIADQEDLSPFDPAPIMDVRVFRRGILSYVFDFQSSTDNTSIRSYALRVPGEKPVTSSTPLLPYRFASFKSYTLMALIQDDLGQGAIKTITVQVTFPFFALLSLLGAILSLGILLGLRKKSLPFLHRFS